jgi:putative lipoprotein
MVRLERSERPRIAKLSGPARGTVVLGLIASGFLAACSRPPAPPARQTAKEPVDSAVSFVNRVWKVRESSSVAPGTLYTFLWDGTLVIAIAHGKPALGQWRPAGDGLTVIEEGRPYRADILRLTREEFSIRLHNPGEPVEITFAPADQPPLANPALLLGGGVVSGTVAYRERMALPPGAVIEVQLSDVSVQDVAAPLIAKTTINPEGRQVPLAFELRYDPAQIDAKRSYAVRATIRSDGQLLFTTTSGSHVITQGNPARVALMLVRATGPAPVAPGGIWGTTWRLVDLGGAGVLDGASATLEFPEPGKAVGNGSCNRFFGPVQVAGDSITFGPLGSTRMACEQAVATQEARYLEQLRLAERYGVTGSTLLVYPRGNAKPLRFSRTRP